LFSLVEAGAGGLAEVGWVGLIFVYTERANCFTQFGLSQLGDTQMKLGIDLKNITWPVFRAWWNGLCGGLLIGGVLGVWFAWSGRIGWWAIWLFPAVPFFALFPDAVAQISQGIKRFRKAQKRQPRA
jgi:hypothetical protein